MIWYISITRAYLFPPRCTTAYTERVREVDEAAAAVAAYEAEVAAVNSQREVDLRFALEDLTQLNNQVGAYHGCSLWLHVGAPHGCMRVLMGTCSCGELGTSPCCALETERALMHASKYLYALEAFFFGVCVALRNPYRAVCAYPCYGCPLVLHPVRCTVLPYPCHSAIDPCILAPFSMHTPCPRRLWSWRTWCGLWAGTPPTLQALAQPLSLPLTRYSVCWACWLHVTRRWCACKGRWAVPTLGWV
jgi:hypothetical protein